MGSYRNPRTTTRKAAKIRAAYALKAMMDDVARQKAERQPFDAEAAAALPVYELTVPPIVDPDSILANMRSDRPAWHAIIDGISPLGGSL